MYYIYPLNNEANILNKKIFFLPQGLAACNRAQSKRETSATGVTDNKLAKEGKGSRKKYLFS